MLECRDGSIYTGITNDVKRRLSLHQSGKGARYTRSRRAVKILYTERCKDRSAALKRETEIKRMPRAKKLDLIKSGRTKKLK